jgi:serine/threonine-protein kinase ULK2
MQNNGYFYIVTEYCRGGDLRNMLENSDEEDNPDREKKILDMFWQVCEGFKYLRTFDIIHRDLKPSNILLQNGLYKIADFGLAKREMVHRSVV